MPDDLPLHFRTQDGAVLAYDTCGDAGPVVVLLHGWSGSRRYFDLNFKELGRQCQVYRYDARFHGDSAGPCWGHHVARLAADLRDFLDAMDLQDVTVVGTSMGASTIWSYTELFGDHRLAKAVFVDQAPLQNLAEDWSNGSTGCYDAVSLARLQSTLKYDFKAVATGNCDLCLNLPIADALRNQLISETLRADADSLGKLMADHTQADWRAVLPRISIPCLNIVAKQTRCFRSEGVEYVSKHIQNCETAYFDTAGHWLYIEQPEAFNNLVLQFVSKA
ncbi:hypothetical protein ABBQ38_015085 [Trebouxia sp. C0009 RCD-2024]